MIKYLNNIEIDREKYDACISKSKNSLVYAQSWYLDTVAENWDVLVFADYKIVMPLPYRRKYGVKYVFLPPWIQQLGLFSDQVIEPVVVKDFIEKIPGSFVLVNILLNYGNFCTEIKVRKRDNYILNLNKSYTDLFKNYSKGRKSNVKQTKNRQFLIKESKNIDALIEIFSMSKGEEIKRSKKDYEVLRSLVYEANKLNKVKVFYVSDENEMEVGGAIFIFHNNRITYLFSAVNNRGREVNAISYLLDHLISKFAGKDYLLDFEGSMINGVAKFFKSFGSEMQPYYLYSSRRYF